MGPIAFLDLESCSLKPRSLPDPVVLSPYVKSLRTAQQCGSWREAGFGFPHFFPLLPLLLVRPQPQVLLESRACAAVL